MQAGLFISGSRFEVLCGNEAIGPRRDLDDAAVSLLRGFAQRYAVLRLMEAKQAAVGLLALGRELYAWLEGDAGQLTQLRERAPRPFVFEIRGPRTPAETQWALLRAPWELLADDRGFLAQDVLLTFCPVRRLGPAETAPPLDNYRLGLAFMASAPRGQRELNYEAEESAILGAVGDGELDLFVEESGDPAELGHRLTDLAAMSALHLSCHGESAWRPKEEPNAAPRPVLLMEDAEGHERPTDAAALIQHLPAAPRFTFLSACLSAAAGEGAKALPAGAAEKRAEPGGAAEGVAHSLATALVEGGFPAVLGWGGSVADVAATVFAGAFYDRLADRVDVARAVADARRVLLNAADKDVRRDWHLARLWLGPGGGGPVVGGGRKRSMLPATHGHKAFLAEDQKVRVASHEMFAGRRRQLQWALRALRDRRHAGVLVHGMGRLGKSSLAARIANRRPDMALAVVFAHYDALSVVEALEGALRAFPPARDLLQERKPQVRADPSALEALLIDLLAGPCAQEHPVLLVIDDLERILVASGTDDRPHRPDPAHASMLSMILRAFDPDRTDSRIVFTSRFPFALNGLEQVLETIPLPPLSDNEQRRLELRQQAAAVSDKRLSAAKERLDLLPQARVLGRGNPGLQDLLGQQQVLSKDVPLAQVQEALKETEAWLEGGGLPQDAKVQAFLKNMQIDALLEQAAAGGQELLRATSVFALPVPAPVLEGLAAEVGGSVVRLRDLGLLDVFEDVVDPSTEALAVNELALARLEPLNEAERKTIARLAVPALFAAWGGIEGTDRRPLRVDWELTRLGMMAADGEVVAACAAHAVKWLQRNHPPAVAGSLGQAAIVLLEGLGRNLPLALLANTAEAFGVAGEGAAAAAVLAKGEDQCDGAVGQDMSPSELRELSRFLFENGNRQLTVGDLDAAQATFERLCRVEIARDNAHQLAVAKGRIADILQARGELDEALRIRREEQLPVYERLGDVREKAVTKGRIADILQARAARSATVACSRNASSAIFAFSVASIFRLGLPTIVSIYHDRADFAPIKPLVPKSGSTSVKARGQADVVSRRRARCRDLSRRVCSGDGLVGE